MIDVRDHTTAAGDTLYVVPYREADDDGPARPATLGIALASGRQPCRVTSHETYWKVDARLTDTEMAELASDLLRAVGCGHDREALIEEVAHLAWQRDSYKRQLDSEQQALRATEKKCAEATAALRAAEARIQTLRDQARPDPITSD